MVFIDLSKAFNTVDRSTLWILLRGYGCPEAFVKIIKEFHYGAMSIGGSVTDPFEISHRLKQRCVLAPTLFTLFVAALLSTVSEHLNAGVFIRTRSDGKLCQLTRLNWQAQKLENFAFVNYYFGAAIVARTLEDAKESCIHFEQVATLFGLTIDKKKTVTLYQPPPGQTSIDPHVEIYGTSLKSVKNFTYLGST